jgi:hypothetical protein
MNRCDWLLALALASALPVAAACAADDAPNDPTSAGSGGASSGPSSGGAASGGSASSGTASTGSGSGGDPLGTCPAPGLGTEPAPRAVGVVEATLVDLDGEPAASAAVSVCGFNICLTGDSDADGRIAINGQGKDIDRPAFKVGDGITHAEFAALLPPGTSVTFADPVTAAPLPALASGAPLVAGQDATSGGVTLSVPAGGAIVIDELLFDTEKRRAFRAVELPTDRTLYGVDPSLGLELVYGATPLGARFCPPAQVRVANTAGWPPGAEVELFVNGVDLVEEFAPYGGWAKVAEGTVTEDGLFVATKPGEGLPILGSFGVRVKASE